MKQKWIKLLIFFVIVFPQCRFVNVRKLDSDSAVCGFVCALTRNAKLLSAHAHSQQNQQPVDIWQSAWRRANEGYSETEQERMRMWWARIDAKVDAKSGDIRVWGTREGRGHFVAISGTGVLLVQEISLKVIWLHASTWFPRFRISDSMCIVYCMCENIFLKKDKRRAPNIRADTKLFIETVLLLFLL